MKCAILLILIVSLYSCNNYSPDSSYSNIPTAADSSAGDRKSEEASAIPEVITAEIVITDSAQDPGTVTAASVQYPAGIAIEGDDTVSQSLRPMDK